MTTSTELAKLKKHSKDDLVAECYRLTDTLASTQNRLETAEDELENAERTTRKRISSLQILLLGKEKEIAHLKGYLERRRDEDARRYEVRYTGMQPQGEAGALAPDHHLGGPYRDPYDMASGASSSSDDWLNI